jgi:heme-degrading monooxygenase HmoA
MSFGTRVAAMIARVWRGWASSVDKADLYQDFLRSTFLPSINAIEGYRGARVMRRVIDGEVEFMTITHFDSIDAIRQFAGADHEAAHVAPRARELLCRFEARCQHFELVLDDTEKAAS